MNYLKMSTLGNDWDFQEENSEDEKNKKVENNENELSQTSFHRQEFLSSRADIIYKVLTKPRDRLAAQRDKLTTVEQFDCSFGIHNISFTNVSNDIVKKTKGFTTIKPRRFISMLSRFLITNFEVIVSCILIVL